MLKTIAIITCIVTLAGCAFTPEKVPLNPTVNVQKQNVGHGKLVAVQVIDVRKSTSLGGRASDYGPAANISLSGDLNKAVKSSLNKILIAYGFKPVNNQSNSSCRLIVRIISLDYNQRAGFWVAGIRVNSTIEAIAKNHSQIFDKIYRTTNKHGTILTPTSQSDAKHINAAMSSTLSKFAQDTKIFKFLAKEPTIRSLDASQKSVLRKYHH